MVVFRHIEGLMGDLMSEVENMEEAAKEKKSVAAAAMAADSELISAMENTLRKRGMLPDADEVNTAAADISQSNYPRGDNLITILYIKIQTYMQASQLCFLSISSYKRDAKLVLKLASWQ